MKKAVFLLLIVAVITLAYALGRHQAPRQSTAGTSRRILYYVDPMNPTFKSDKPGTAACGMALEPVYADNANNAAPSAPLAQLPPGAVSINGNMQRLLGIQMAAVEKSGSTRVVRVLGRVVPDDTRIYRINSGMEGYVRETYNDSVGTLVKKDQKLATCYGPDSLSVASGFLAATASVPGAVGKDGNRTVPFPGALSKQGLSSLQGYTDRLRNLGMSDVQIKQMAESRQLPASVDVVAPVEGFMSRPEHYARPAFRSLHGVLPRRRSEPSLDHRGNLRKRSAVFSPWRRGARDPAGPAQVFFGARQQCFARGGYRLHIP